MQSSMVKAAMRNTSRVSRREVTPVPQGWISAPMMLTAKFCVYELNRLAAQPHKVKRKDAYQDYQERRHELKWSRFVKCEQNLLTSTISRSFVRPLPWSHNILTQVAHNLLTNFSRLGLQIISSTRVESIFRRLNLEGSRCRNLFLLTLFWPPTKSNALSWLRLSVYRTERVRIFAEPHHFHCSYFFL